METFELPAEVLAVNRRDAINALNEFNGYCGSLVEAIKAMGCYGHVETFNWNTGMAKDYDPCWFMA